jgi:hypothetical protein
MVGDSQPRLFARKGIGAVTRKKPEELTHDEIWTHPQAAIVFEAVRWRRRVNGLPRPAGEALEDVMRHQIEVREKSRRFLVKRST